MKLHLLAAFLLLSCTFVVQAKDDGSSRNRDSTGGYGDDDRRADGPLGESSSLSDFDEDQMAQQVQDMLKRQQPTTEQVQIRAFFYSTLGESALGLDAAAAEHDDEKEGRKPKDKEDVVTTVYFGEDNELLVRVHNAWDKPITVFSLSGSYRQPQNPEQVIKNVTEQRVLMDVPVGQSATLVYPLRPDMLLPAEQAVLLRVLVDFTDADKKQWYKQVVYERPIRIVEPPPTPFSLMLLVADWQVAGILLVLLLLVLTLVGLAAAKSSSHHHLLHPALNLGQLIQARKKGRSREKEMAGDNNDDDDDEWIPPHVKAALKKGQ